jgi:hypothetical protein
MLSIEQLLKLVNRRRHFKLLREGIAYIISNKIETAGRIFDNSGRMILYDDTGFTLLLYSDGSIERGIKKNNFPRTATTPTTYESWEKVSYSECKFERFANHIVDSMARRISNCLYLFIPKEKLTPNIILRCQNQTIQSRLIEIYGEKEFFASLNPQVIHKEGTSELLAVQISGVEESPDTVGREGSIVEVRRRFFQRRIVMVRVVDPSTKKTYLLRVPPTTKTCKEAVAWTFGMKKEEYDPLEEN